MTETQHAIDVMEKAKQEIFRLRAALDPFVKHWIKNRDPIGESDLDDEQPALVRVTLGDLRRAARLIGR